MVVVNQDPTTILDVCPLDVIQFHGDEPPEQVSAFGRRAVKAIRVRDEDDLQALARYPTVSAFLLDAYVPGVPGGTGQSFPWRLAAIAKSSGRRIIVAGGLTPENVAECVRSAEPYGVDVSSGVEASPGKKDHARVRAFVEAARRATRELGDET
jgi:phosphoribosylanthranilate isomerase